MRRLVVLGLLLAATACGGVQVPTHNGYKSATAKPWKKPKQLKLNDKGEAKTEGDLSYPDMRRAAWLAIDTPSNGTLDLRLEITPPGDATNDDFDLGMEVYSPEYKMLSRSDTEEADAHELNKKQTLVELPPGKYLVHLYLQGRLDTAEYVLHLVFKQTQPSAAKSDFPVQVAYVPTLPMVPLDDDTPKTYKPPQVVVVSHPTQGHKPPAPPPKEVPKAITGRILGISVQGKNVLVTIGRGTTTGATPKMSGTISGVAGPFQVECTERTCTGLVAATADQLKNASSVNLSPSP